MSYIQIVMPEKENDVKITVLMSFYNEKEIYLRQSIESILAQTFSNFEFLIINDGSTDEKCQQVVTEYSDMDKRINTVENEKNLGLTKSLNKGLRIAKGVYIARIDADDLAEKNRLERQLSFLTNNPDYVLCGSWATIIDENGAQIGRKNGFVEYEDIKKRIISANFFTHSSLFFKKSTVLSLGGYNEKLKKSQDYDLLLHLVPGYKIKNLPEYLSVYRFRTDNISFTNNKEQERGSLKIRLRALREYGYPKKYYLKLLRPVFLHFLVPSSLKMYLIKLSWKI